MLMYDGYYRGRRYGAFAQDDETDFWDMASDIGGKLIDAAGKIIPAVITGGVPSTTAPWPAAPTGSGQTPITSGGTPVQVPVVGHVSPTVLVAGLAGLGLIAFLAMRK